MCGGPRSGAHNGWFANQVYASKSRYYVVYDGGWMIQCDGENSEPYLHRKRCLPGCGGAWPTSTSATAAQADVIVQCDDDLFRPEWDSSRDPYPPPLVPEL